MRPTEELGTEPLGIGDCRVTIAVIDGPVVLRHPCFRGATLDAAFFAEIDGTEGPAAAHGTHVASILFGQDDTSVLGLTPRCRGLLIPVFREFAGGYGCSQVDLARAIVLAVEHGAQVINISGGEVADTAEAHPLLTDALALCQSRNVLVVAAVGNDGCDCIHVPAALDGTLAVGASDAEGQPLAQSNFGARFRENGLLAPGIGVLGATPEGGVIRRTGTSFATPLVSGVAALLLSYQLRLNAEPDPLWIREVLLRSATPCAAKGRDCSRFLRGRLNVAAAIELLHLEITRRMPVFKEGNVTAPSDTVEMSSNAAVSSPSVAAAGYVRAAAQQAGAIAPAEVTASGCDCGGAATEGCSCGCGAKSAGAPSRPQLVYALGTLGIDFGTEARRDSVQQYMPDGKFAAKPDDFLEYVNASPEEAERAIWTLNLGTTPIYAIQPIGAFSEGAYDKLVDGLRIQIERQDAGEPVPLFAAPGVISGTIRLMTGDVVPVIVPRIRGLTGWDIDASIENASEKLRQQGKTDEEVEQFKTTATEPLRNFLDRVERKNRNLGITGSDRALNFAATSAYRVLQVLTDVVGLQLELGDIDVARSAVCRPGSECFDVDLRFFSPDDVRKPDYVFRFTVDVSDSVPVSIGKVAAWKERPRQSLGR